MTRKKSPRSVSPVQDTFETLLGKQQPQTPARRGKGRTRTLTYEALEGRTVLSATPGAVIHGEVYNDLTNGGHTSDGPGLQAVTVNLYLDNGSGTFSSSDTLVASQQTDASGNYSFAGLAAGTYFVQEVLPSGYVLPANASAVDKVVISRPPRPRALPPRRSILSPRRN